MFADRRAVVGFRPTLGRSAPSGDLVAGAWRSFHGFRLMNGHTPAIGSGRAANYAWVSQTSWPPFPNSFSSTPNWRSGKGPAFHRGRHGGALVSIADLLLGAREGCPSPCGRLLSSCFAVRVSVSSFALVGLLAIRGRWLVTGRNVPVMHVHVKRIVLVMLHTAHGKSAMFLKWQG